MLEERLVWNLLTWFVENARDLPWRRSRDPYAIWISEVMLQQTQVHTVLPYWERWMRALPTVRALANASSERIHKLWEGLGYYSRVRNLQRAAKEVITEHDGKLPSNAEALLRLPGIGRYTAGAICSIAFDQPTPIVDGNVIRVLARVFAVSGSIREPKFRNQVWEIAGRLVRTAKGAPFDQPCSQFNQALMELGATVCRPRDARCDCCPVAPECAARKQGRVDELPALPKGPQVKKRRFMAFVIEQQGKLLLRQRPDGVVNGQLWEFPNVEVGFKRKSPDQVAAELFGVPTTIRGTLDSVKHSITRYRMILEPYIGKPAGKLSATAGVWVGRNRLKLLAFSSAHKKVLRAFDQRRRLERVGRVRRVGQLGEVG